MIESTSSCTKASGSNPNSFTANGTIDARNSAPGISLFLERYAAGRMLHHPLALGDRELAEQKEALARGGGDPVGVAAPGVEERRLRGAGCLLRELDQLVLDLERAQGLELLQGHEVTHGNRLRRLVASVLSIRRRAASRALAAVNAVPIVSIVSSSPRWVLRHESSMMTIIPQTVRSVFPTA